MHLGGEGAHFISVGRGLWYSLPHLRFFNHIFDFSILWKGCSCKNAFLIRSQVELQHLRVQHSANNTANAFRANTKQILLCVL